jgi:tyrosinase
MTKTIRRVTRRDALKFGAVGIGVTVATGVGIGDALAQSLYGPPLRIRRNINDPVNGADVASAYREGVAMLRALPSTNVSNWTSQGDIHRNFCPHGNWYFLPWHRAYLLALENILSDAIGDPAFGLPYWNWTIDRIMPPAVADATVGSAANSLHNATRVMQPNQTLTQRLIPFGIDAEAVFGQTNLDAILNARPFQPFGSFKPVGQDSIDPTQWQRASGSKATLEQEPHDTAHGAVGGDMGGVPTSPRDPIFYLHHCNLDRIWAKWNEGGGVNDSDPLFSTFKFVQNFWDQSGTLVDVTVSDLYDTVTLGYRYDDVAPSTLVAALAAPAGMAMETQITVLGQAATAATVPPAQVTELPVQASGGAVKAAAEQPAGLAMTAGAAARVYAFIRDISIPADTAVGVRVFINCPYLGPETPSDDPHYAGAFTFFADKEMQGMAGHSQSVAVDITDTLASVRRAGTSVEEQIVVQLLPMAEGADAEAVTFTVGSVEIATL